MAWTSPRTWVTGEIVTASLMNVHVRDNEDYIKGNAGIVAIASGMSLAHGAITTDLNTLGATVTWNAGGVTFTALEINVTDTASAAASLLMDLQVAGVSKFKVTKAGTGTLAGDLIVTAGNLGIGTTSPGTDAGSSSGDYSGQIAHLKGAGVAARYIVESDQASGASVEWVDSAGGANDKIIYFTATGGVGKFVSRSDNLGTRFDNILVMDMGNGSVFINDTSNANATLGLTINQGAADDEILALRSSDVAHGVTDVTATNTYLSVKKMTATAGGVWLDGISEGVGSMTLRGIQTTVSTVKSTGAAGAVHIDGALKSGTGVASLGADANIAVIRDNGTTRFIFDAEGSGHADIEWVAFDAHDDLALVDALNHEFARRRDPAHASVTAEFGAWLDSKRDELQRAGIVNFYDSGPRAMVNTTRLAMLSVGALRQLGARLAALEQHLGLEPGYVPRLVSGGAA